MQGSKERDGRKGDVISVKISVFSASQLSEGLFFYFANHVEELQHSSKPSIYKSGLVSQVRWLVASPRIHSWVTDSTFNLIRNSYFRNICFATVNKYRENDIYNFKAIVIYKTILED